MWIALTVFLITVIVYRYLVAPLRMRSRWWLSVTVPFEPVAPHDSLVPEGVRVFWHRVSCELAELGFSAVAQFAQTEAAPNTVLYAAVFRDPAGVDSAAAVAVWSRVSPVRTAQNCTVEFTRRFDDGTECTTSNWRKAGWLAVPNWRKTWRFPGMTNLRMMYAIHRQLTALVAGTAVRLSMDPEASRAELHRDFVRDLRAQAEMGYLYEETDSGRVRFTIKGAFLTAWGRLWPVGAVRRWAIRRRARTILEKLGLPTYYATMTYDRPPAPAEPEAIAPPTLFCPQCDYNLSGLSENRCPECGRPFVREELARQAARTPQPIARSNLARLLIEPLVFFTVGTVACAGILRLGRVKKELFVILGTVAIIIAAVSFLLLVREGYTGAREAAKRLAVNRARRQGVDRSGLHDKAIITPAFVALYATQLVVGAVLVIVLIFLFKGC